MKQIRIATISILLFMMVMPVMAQSAKIEDDDAKYATELLKGGAAAPDFTLNTIDGKIFRLNDLKGRYVVIDFWASWCPDCRKDLPNIIRIYNEYHKQGVEFVGVSFDTDKAAWKSAVEKNAIPYAQVSELKKFHDTEISKAYGVKWIPSMYLIGKDGKVILGTVLSDKLEKTLAGLGNKK